MAGTAKLSPKNETLLDPGLLNAALEAFPLGLAIAEKGRILYANPGFAQRFGLHRKADMQGGAAKELVPELNSLNGRNGSALSSVADFQINGRSLQVISAPVNNESTEACEMEAVGRLVSGVAHDFNNLLTGILLYCDLLLTGLKEPHLRHHAEEIRSAGEHGAALIQQLMVAARRQTIDPQAMSWNQAISDVRNLLTRLLGENIDLRTDLEHDLDLVKIDPAQAHQIILNLVLNARDAMPQGGQIMLRTRNGSKPAMHIAGKNPGIPAYIELRVSDTGMGMDHETRKHIFERFFTTKKPGRGTGLGLATVYDLVQEICLMGFPESAVRCDCNDFNSGLLKVSACNCSSKGTSSPSSEEGTIRFAVTARVLLRRKAANSVSNPIGTPTIQIQ
jgi:signal transduction histidine kinase